MAGIMDFTTPEPTVPMSLFADRRITLAPDDYPNETWHAQTVQYNRWWSYFKGYILNKKNEQNVELYPVRLNIVRSAVINHAAVLLGQFSDDNVVQFSLKNSPGINDSVKEPVNKAMNLLWAINNGDDIFIEQALTKQIFGGDFYKVAWQPLRRKWPIRFFSVDPRACFPVWDGDDYNRLQSIDVYHQIPKPTAKSRYRMDIAQGASDFVTVHEHWDEQEYFIKFDEEVGRWPDGSEMQGDNPFLDPVLGLPIIPYVYSPRLRVSEFWGESIVPSLSGPQDEINNNLAHLGEGLADAMHQQPWIRDRDKGTQGLNKNRDEWINLGNTRPGSKNPPEAGRLPGAQMNDAMTDYVVRDLVMLAREHGNMPDVAYGRTDASIRSALTLKYMMWPALNVGLQYRKHAATGFKHLMYMAFVIAHSKRNIVSNLNGVSSLGIDAITPEMIEAVLLAHKTNFAPMLPDDRAELVNEMVQRLSASIISPETAIRRLDGSDELEEELNRIDEHRKKVQEMMEERMDNPPGENSDNSTNRAQAEGGRSSPQGE